MRRLCSSALGIVVVLAGCSQGILRPRPDAADEALEAYREALWAELLPDLDALTSEDIMDTADRLARKYLAPVRDVLADKAAEALARLPACPPFDRVGWEDVAAPMSGSALEEVLSEGEDRSGLLLASLWDPTSAASTARNLVMARSLGPEGMGKRALVHAIAPARATALTRDADRPVVAFWSGEEVVLVTLRRPGDGTYRPEKVEWLRRRRE